MSYFLESGCVDDDLRIARCQHGHHPDGCVRCDLLRTERANRRGAYVPTYPPPTEAPKGPAWIGLDDMEPTQEQGDATSALLGVSSLGRVRPPGGPEPLGEAWACRFCGVSLRGERHRFTVEQEFEMAEKAKGAFDADE